MNNAETLREAARVMRERAQAATPGPWVSDAPAATWRTWDGNVTTLHPDFEDVDDAIAKTLSNDDAHHIAGMSPAVALAVADWLDDAAGPLWCDGCGSSDDECRTSPGRGFIKCCPDCGHGRKALAVARAYLGTADGRVIR